MSEELVLKFVDPQPMRYGENSHQSAVFYRDPTCTEASLATAKQLWGKELSYNNIVDADAALEMAREFAGENAVVIVKHMNPCGLATGKTLDKAFEAAWAGDPVSAFGSVIAVTKKVDLKTAMLLKGRFVEILLAPAFEKDALEFLKNKSKDIRLLEVGEIKKATKMKVYKHVIGGMLVQDRDVDVYEKFECVTKKKFPKNREIAHVYASALSMWGNERGALTSVKEGVATTVRDVAIMAEDYQVLGRAHFVLPYVPLVLSWPDKKLADKYLSLALEKNPRDLYNYFFLAELRFDQKRYADALNIIDRGLSRGIRTNNFLEDKRGRWQLKELQKKINAKLDKK